MKKGIIILLALIVAAPLFATSYDYVAVGAGVDLGKANIITDSIEVKNVDLDLRLEGAIYFTDPSSKVQLGLGVDAYLGIPLSQTSNGQKVTDKGIPSGVAVTFDTAFRINRDFAIDARAGFGFRHTTLSTETIKYGSLILGTEELRQSDFFAVAGIGGRYFIEDDLAIKFGADVSYTFFASLETVVSDNSHYHNNTDILSDIEINRLSVKPYVAIAFGMGE